MSVINPLTLSAASAITVGTGAATGEVQHPSAGSPLDNETIATTTRQLAQRDLLLAAAVSSLIQQANNSEQYITLPVVTITLPPSTAEIIANFRIPAGFESRVFNAIIATTPDGGGRLEVLHNSDGDTSTTAFGGVDGTSVVSTADESSGGTSFYPSGEFIVRITNEAANSIDLTASVILTLRPVSATDGSLLGPGAVGQRGQKGDKGSKGDQGDAGPRGLPGIAGLNWRGAYNPASAYAVGDVVSHGYPSGQPLSSWVALLANDSGSAVEPGADSTVWDLAAANGAQGVTGAQGNPGATGSVGPQGNQGNQGNQGPQGQIGAVFRGEWNSVTPYLGADLVSVSTVLGSGTLIASFIASGTNLNVPPPGDTTGTWSPFMQPTVSALYSKNTVYGTLTRRSGFSAGSPTGLFTVPVTGQGVPWTQTVAVSSQNGQATLYGQANFTFSGSATVTLPQVTDGAARNWTAADLAISVAGAAADVTQSPAGTSEIGLQSNTSNAKVTLIFVGVGPIS